MYDDTNLPQHPPTHKKGIGVALSTQQNYLIYDSYRASSTGTLLLKPWPNCQSRFTWVTLGLARTQNPRPCPGLRAGSEP